MTRHRALRNFTWGGLRVARVPFVAGNFPRQKHHHLRDFFLRTAHTGERSLRNGFRLRISDQGSGFLQQRDAIAQDIRAMKMKLRILGAISQQGIHKQALGYRLLIALGVNPPPLAHIGIYERAMFILEESAMPDSRVMHCHDGGFGKVWPNQLESL